MTVDLASYLVGHADVETGRLGGVVPLRLPAWADRQHDRPDLRWAARNPAGVRLRLRTAARTVTVTLHATVIEHASEAVTPRVTVYEAGRCTVRNVPGATVLRIGDTAGTPTVAGIDLGRAYDLVIHRRGTDDLLEILLPHNCQIELLGIHADAPVAPAGPDGSPVWVHYGSSISHGSQAREPQQPWPVQVARQVGLDLRNLSYSGNAQLDPFAARVAAGFPADLITAKIGINVVNGDSMRAGPFRTAVHGFLDTVRERLPSVPVVLVSAISCPLQEQSPGPVLAVDGQFVIGRREVEGERGALTLALSRQIVAEVVHARSAGDRRLHYVDGRSLFGPDDAGSLFDGLHPDQQGTDLIAARFWASLPERVRDLVAASDQPKTSAER